jgi:uncharacterized membrane protein YqjE
MSNSTGRYSRKTVEVKAVHTNLQQEVIQITEDKLRLVLSNYLTALEQRKSWIAPLGLLLTIIVVFSTSTFKDAYFKASTWEAFFLMGGFLTCIWLILSVIKAINTKKIDDVLTEIKDNSSTE